MTFDPYAELGVPRDAGEPEIKRAYKRRVKETHPDAGGDEEAFGRTKLALVVLTDPEKRERFDNTGTVDDDKPDNVRAGAIQVVERHLAAALNAYVKSNFAAASDPRHRDVVAEIRLAVAAEIAEFDGGIKTGGRVVTFYSDMASRIESEDDFMRRGLEQQVRAAEAQIETFREGIKMRELALKMLAGCVFRFDPAPAPTFSALGGHIVGFTTGF